VALHVPPRFDTVTKRRDARAAAVVLKVKSVRLPAGGAVADPAEHVYLARERSCETHGRDHGCKRNQSWVGVTRLGATEIGDLLTAIRPAVRGWAVYCGHWFWSARTPR